MAYYCVFQEKEQKRRLEALKENKGLSLQQLCGDDVSIRYRTIVIKFSQYILCKTIISLPLNSRNADNILNMKHLEDAMTEGKDSKVASNRLRPKA